MPGIGGTVADLLDVMSMLDNELDTAAGGVNESQCIKALTQAQKQFENIAAMFPRVYQSTINVVTTANTETTTTPTTLRRFDALWQLDSNGRPLFKIERIDQVGGHVPSLPWPLQISLATGTGAPGGYYANMSNFYWLPMPDGVYSVRIYGLIAQPSFVDRNSNYNYHDYTQLSVAQVAVKLLSVGVDDDTTSIDELSSLTFKPLLRSVRKFDRSGPRGRVYSKVHDT